MQFIEDLNDKILKIEAETEANMELIGEGVGSDLEQKFVQLEANQRGDQALLELKAKLESQKQIELVTIDHDIENHRIKMESK